MLPLKNLCYMFTGRALHGNFAGDCSKVIIGLIYLERSTSCTDAGRSVLRSETIRIKQENNQTHV